VPRCCKRLAIPEQLTVLHSSPSVIGSRQQVDLGVSKSIPQNKIPSPIHTVSKNSNEIMMSRGIYTSLGFFSMGLLNMNGWDYAKSPNHTDSP
jgi:hypothetical protein